MRRQAGCLQGAGYGDIIVILGRAPHLVEQPRRRFDVRHHPGDWIAPRAHINAAGACFAGTRELDTNAVLSARLYVDRRESALNDSGVILLPAVGGRPRRRLQRPQFPPQTKH
jgi:hypothetical protein